MNLENLSDDDLLYPGEVSAIFRVSRKTVTRWADRGWLPAIRTPGRHRRYRVGDVRVLLRGDRHFEIPESEHSEPLLEPGPK